MSVVIPGTHEPGYVEQPLQEFHRPELRRALRAEGALGVRFWHLGECEVIVSRDPCGPNGELLWHLSISHRDRHPSWDEIKTARYRCLPDDRVFALLLPPSDEWVNVPEQDHVFSMWEVTDPRHG